MYNDLSQTFVNLSCNQICASESNQYHIFRRVMWYLVRLYSSLFRHVVRAGSAILIICIVGCSINVAYAKRADKPVDFTAVMFDSPVIEEEQAESKPLPETYSIESAGSEINITDDAASELIEALTLNGLLEQQTDTIAMEFKKMTTAVILLIVCMLVIAVISILMVRKKGDRQIVAVESQIVEIRNSLEKSKTQTSNQKNSEQPKRISGEKNKKDDFVISVTKAILDSPNLVCNVESLAVRLNMSVQTLRRHIFKATGDSPKIFINKIKMQRAGELLKSRHDMSVAQIAGLCGFTESSSFIRAFQSVYNMTPTQYRMKYKGHKEQ